MTADPHARENKVAPPSCRPDPREISRLRTRVFLYGVGFSALSGAVLFAATWLLVIPTFQTLKGLPVAPDGDPVPSLADFAASRPDLLAGFAGLLVLGALIAVAGVWIVSRTLGPGREPPRRVVLSLVLLPLPFVLFGATLAITEGGLLTGILGCGVMFPGYFWLIPLQLVLLVVAMLGIALASARQKQVFVETDTLPKKAVAYFNQVEPDMLEAGLDPIGDIAYEFTNGKCRRLWANRDRTFFASASSIPTGNGVLQAVSVYAVTDDDTYLEAANVPGDLFSAPEGFEQFFHNEPNATPTEVLTNFAAMFRAWIVSSGSLPMRIRDDEHEKLFDYGNAWLSKARGAGKKKTYATELMWLADIWNGKALPPLPGTPWRPEASYETADR